MYESEDIRDICRCSENKNLEKLKHKCLGGGSRDEAKDPGRFSIETRRGAQCGGIQIQILWDSQAGYSEGQKGRRE